MITQSTVGFLLYMYDYDSDFLEITMNAQQHIALLENDYPVDGNLTEAFHTSAFMKRLSYAQYKNMLTTSVEWAQLRLKSLQDA
jgi:hypothetical protein